MAFESVDVGSLKSAISSCISSINYQDSLTIKGNIGNDNIWCSESRTNLKNGLSKLTGTRYKDLKEQLGVANTVADLIAQYKNLEQENIEYNNKIAELSKRLYYEESYISGYYIDDYGDSHETWDTRTVMDQQVANEIAELQQKIQKNEEKMKEIEDNVKSIVG